MVLIVTGKIKVHNKLEQVLLDLYYRLSVTFSGQTRGDYIEHAGPHTTIV